MRKAAAAAVAGFVRLGIVEGMVRVVVEIGLVCLRVAQGQERLVVEVEVEVELPHWKVNDPAALGPELVWNFASEPPYAIFFQKYDFQLIPKCT